MQKIRAIPTKYNDILFRSRLEARWAVFFDALGIEYFYEYEGYQLPSGWYLPDFYLPELGKDGAFIEIKPCPPTQQEETFCEELALATTKRVLLQMGDISYPKGVERAVNSQDVQNYAQLYDVGWCPETQEKYLIWDLYYYWCECPTCGEYGVEHAGWTGRLKCGCTEHKTANWDSVSLLSAYRQAQKYRFW